MKQKKYIITLIIMIITIFVKANPVYAGAKNFKTCYYIHTESDGTQTKYVLELKSGYTDETPTDLESYAYLRIDYAGGTNEGGDEEQINNWFLSAGYSTTTAANDIVYKTPTTVQFYNTSASAANKLSQSQLICPKYIVFQKCLLYYREWATESKSHAEALVKAINKTSRCSGFYAANGGEDSSGNIVSEYTAADYYGENLVTDDNIGSSASGNIFGDSSDAGSGCTDDGTCTTYPTISYLLTEAINWIKIIVPILLITLGTIDFAKAVVAGNEEQMRKARTSFVKRAIAALAIFFVPTIVSILREITSSIFEW